MACFEGTDRGGMEVDFFGEIGSSTIIGVVPLVLVGGGKSSNF